MCRLKLALLVALTLAFPISGCGEATEDNAAICVAGAEELQHEIIDELIGSLQRASAASAVVPRLTDAQPLV